MRARLVRRLACGPALEVDLGAGDELLEAVDRRLADRGAAGGSGGVANEAAIRELIDHVEVQVGFFELLDNASLPEIDVGADGFAGVGARVVMAVVREDLRRSKLTPFLLDPGANEPG